MPEPPHSWITSRLTNSLHVSTPSPSLSSIASVSPANESTEDVSRDDTSSAMPALPSTTALTMAPMSFWSSPRSMVSLSSAS